MSLSLLSLLGLLGMAAVHVLAGPLLFERATARGRWLSLGSGASVAYVFLHLLPEVTDREAALVAAADDAVGEPVWVLALAGLVAFYGLEIRTRQSRRDTAAGAAVKPSTFAASIALFALFNVAVGYLLVRTQAETAADLALFTLAVGVHLLVVDYALREHHRTSYHRRGRWLLAAALLAGGALGAVTVLPDWGLGALLAFLAGGILLNTLKEELPEHRDSHFPSFAAGAGTYTAFLLVV